MGAAVPFERDDVAPIGTAPKLSTHPVDVGQRTEAIILSELVRRGYQVLIPFGMNQRYDMVIDVEGRFLRAQCKTGRLRRGVVDFSSQSTQSNTRRTVTRGYVGEADLFLIFCPDNGKIYAVPVDETPRSHGSLRVSETLNGQSQGVRWAKDYELPA